MEGVLPDVINHRKDKLGHSVPFKVWLRGDGTLGRVVAETLQSERFRARGLFRDDAVRSLLDEHRQRRHNHSHRLWALFVLEHWLRRAFDSPPAARPVLESAPSIAVPAAPFARKAYAVEPLADEARKANPSFAREPAEKLIAHAADHQR
jgi:hypothetical protein